MQCNLVALRRTEIDDFLEFSRLNPVACLLIDIAEPGCPEPRRAAPGADLRTELPRYAVFAAGRQIAAPYDVREQWDQDTVGVLLSSSMSLDALVHRAIDAASVSPSTSNAPESRHIWR